MTKPFSLGSCPDIVDFAEVAFGYRRTVIPPKALKLIAAASRDWLKNWVKYQKNEANKMVPAKDFIFKKDKSKYRKHDKRNSFLNYL